MTNKKNIRINVSFFGLFFILCIFIGAFYILSSAYSNSNGSKHAVILDSSLFKEDSDAMDSFDVSNIARSSIPYDIHDSELINNDSILFTEADTENYKFRSLNILDVNSGKKVTIDAFECNYINKINVSPNGKEVLYSYMDSNMKSVTVLYDIDKKIKMNTFFGVYNTCWLPDSSGFIGVDESTIFLQDLKNQNARKVISKLDISTAYKNRSINNYYRTTQLAISKDGSKVFFLNSNNNEDVLYEADINMVNTFEVFRGHISSFAVLNNNTIVISGFYNPQNGIYIYDLINHKFSNIINTTNYKMVGFSISPDGKKIVYDLVGNNMNVIHAAYINDGKIAYDDVIYRDTKYISDITWTRDSRRVIGIINESGASEIYKFSFKNIQ